MILKPVLASALLMSKHHYHPAFHHSMMFACVLYTEIITFARKIMHYLPFSTALGLQWLLEIQLHHQEQKGRLISFFVSDVGDFPGGISPVLRLT